jgi:hypothetical protein
MDEISNQSFVSANGVFVERRAVGSGNRARIVSEVGQGGKSQPIPTVRTLLIRFRSADALAAWEASAVRRSLEREGNLFSAAYYREPRGLEAFFSVPRMSSVPSLWKMCLVTTPTVFVLFNATPFAVLRVVPSAKAGPRKVGTMAAPFHRDRQ